MCCCCCQAVACCLLPPSRALLAAADRLRACVKAAPQLLLLLVALVAPESALAPALQRDCAMRRIAAIAAAALMSEQERVPEVTPREDSVKGSHRWSASRL